MPILSTFSSIGTLSLLCVASVMQLISASIVVQYVVKEESQRGTFVGNLKVDSKIESKLSGNINFQIYEATKVTKHFRLENTTGKLFIEKVIDREELFPGDMEIENCKLEFSVLVSTQLWINVKVMIMDINDHQPTFPTPTREIKISEAVRTGYKIPLVPATDIDAHPNNVKNYSLTGVDNIFTVEYRRLYSLHLVVVESLDYEKTKSYNATLVACDGGTPKSCSSQLLLISVTDVNDNKPIFQENVYRTEVLENATLGHVVARVKATDADSGRFGDVRYSFGQMYDMNAVNHFTIRDQEGYGEIILKKKLNAKKTPQFTIMINAVDNGDIPYMGQTSLKVKVIDINNHRPRIQIKPLNNGAQDITVKENSKSKTHIGLVWASDEDTMENGKVTCAITSGEKNFKLEHSNSANNREIYSLLTNASFDRETTSRLPIQIRCHDQGTPQLRSEEDFDVKILDQNEYPPVFEHSLYNASIDENRPVGVRVLKVRATDKDATSQITYEIIPDAASYFQIDPESGTITTVALLDRETTKEIRFTVKAIDKAEPRRFTATASVVVTVRDVNDNEPHLVQVRNFVVMENLPGSSGELGTLSSLDQDDGLNGTVQYSLVRVSSNGQIMSNSTFSVDRFKGSLRAREKLDREKYNSYQLHILLYDLGIPSRSSIESITVEVLDENDNAPRWLYPHEGDRNLNFTGVVRPGEKLCSVRAEDYDSPKNANLTYTLLMGHGFFNLGFLSGDLYAADMLPEGQYELHLRVSDNGRPEIPADERLFVNVLPGGLGMGDKHEKARLSFTLIIGMVAVTLVICISLIIAIAVLRNRARSGLLGTYGLRKWAEENTYVADTWSRPGHFGPPPAMHTFTGQPQIDTKDPALAAVAANNQMS